MEWVVVGLLIWWWHRRSGARARADRSYGCAHAAPAAVIMAVVDGFAYWRAEGALVRAPWREGRADLEGLEFADPLVLDGLSPVLVIEILEALDAAERDGAETHS